MDTEKRKITLICDICKEEPATGIKGGVFNNIRDIWLICKNCKNKIVDTRLKNV